MIYVLVINFKLNLLIYFFSAFISTIIYNRKKYLIKINNINKY